VISAPIDFSPENQDCDLKIIARILSCCSRAVGAV
jgi:hypothetical protein